MPTVERQIFVGNLPPTITNALLIDLLNKIVTKNNLNTQPGDSVTNAWAIHNLSSLIPETSHYAFVEFRTKDEAMKGLLLENYLLQEYPLKVGKIKIDNSSSHSTPLAKIYKPSAMIDTSYNQKKAPPTVAQAMLSGIMKKPVTVNSIPAPVLPDNSNKASLSMNSSTNSSSGIKLMYKLYVNNLPLNLKEKEVFEIFKIFGKILKVDIIPDPKTKQSSGQAFIEFENEIELQKAATSTLGLNILGHILETKKVPAIYNSSMANLSWLLLNEGTNPGKSNLVGGKCLLDGHPSRVIKLKNVVNVNEIMDSTYFDDLFDDTQEQCQKYGYVHQVVIPRPEGEAHCPGIGNIFIQYESVEEAIQAKKGLNGMTFNGKVIECVFFPEDSFRKKLFGL